MKYCAVFLLLCLFCTGSVLALYNLDEQDYLTCIVNDGSYPASVGLVIDSYPVEGVQIQVEDQPIGTTPYQLKAAYDWYGAGQSVGPWVPFKLTGGPLGTNAAYGSFRVCPLPKITIINANLNPVMPTPAPTPSVMKLGTVAILTLSTIKPVVTITGVKISTAALPTTVATTTATTTSTTQAGVPASGTGSTVAPAGSGSLSVTTTPAGAAVYIDGVQQGVSPAIIPGLAAGTHTVLLRLDGYQDLSLPVSITAGKMNEYSTGLIPLSAGSTLVPATTAAGAPAPATKAPFPGCETAAVACAVGALLFFRKTNP